MGPGQGDSEAGVTTDAPTILAPTETGQAHSPLPLILGLILLLLLALLALWYFLSSRPVPLRLRLGDKSPPRDYRLRPGARIALGGTLATATGTQDIFPLAGLTAPAAFVAGVRGGLNLAPAPAADGSPTLFHNGLPLKQAAPLRVGDELRVTTPTTEAEPGREHRIRVEDPHGSAF